MADKLSPLALEPEAIQRLFGRSAGILRPVYGPPRFVTRAERELAKETSDDQAIRAYAHSLVRSSDPGYSGIRDRSVGRPQSSNIEDRRHPNILQQLGGSLNSYMDWAKMQGPSTGGGFNFVSNSTKGGMSDPKVVGTIIAEAGDDPKAQAAVAWVIRNRAEKTGKSPLEVVKQKGQFEGYSNPGYGSEKAKADPKVRSRAEEVAKNVATGSVADPTGGGTMFHADSMTPYWAKSADKNGTVNIGGNLFYKGDAPSSAASAIDSAFPPLPAPRPLAYAPSVPKVRSIEINPDGTPVAPPPMPRPRPSSGLSTLAPPNLPLNPVLPPMPAAGRSTVVQRNAHGLTPSLPMTPSVPQPLTSHSVHTVAIDPMTGNPVDPRGTTQDGANREAARLALQRSGTLKTTGAAGTVQMPAGVRPAVADNLIAQATAAQPQTYQPGMTGRGLPTVSAPPQITVAQRNALASTAGTASPVRVASIPGQPAGSIAIGKDTSQLPANAYAGTYSPPPAVAAIDAVTAPRVAPVPRPRPLPTVPVPRISAPAAIPLTNFNTVNPMSQIAPRVGAYFNTTPAGHVVQALTGQPIQGGLLGGLFSLFGNRQQAPNAPVAAPQAPQQPGMVSDQLSGGNSSIFTTNTLMPSSMSSTPEQKRRWFGDGY